MITALRGPSSWRDAILFSQDRQSLFKSHGQRPWFTLEIRKRGSMIEFYALLNLYEYTRYWCDEFAMKLVVTLTKLKYLNAAKTCDIINATVPITV